jgi:hypothetical protein
MASISNVLISAMLLLGAGPFAHGDSIESDPTITVIEEAESPDDIVQAISMPDQHTAGARINDPSSAAPSANAEARDFGHEVSQDARNRARTDVPIDNPARARHGAN